MTIPSGFGQATWFFNGPAVPQGAVCTMGLDLGSILDPAVAAEAAYEAWEASYLLSQTLALGLTGCRVKFGPDSTGPFAEYYRTTNGGGNAASVPPNVSALIKKQTAVGGRSGRGRMFVPGLPESWVGDGGLIDGQIVTDLEVAGQILIADLTTAGLVPTLLHSGTMPPSTITSLVPDTRVATQRRRLR